MYYILLKAIYSLSVDIPITPSATFRRHGGILITRATAALPTQAPSEVPRLRMTEQLKRPALREADCGFVTGHNTPSPSEKQLSLGFPVASLL